MSSGIEEIQYFGNRAKDSNAGLSTSLGQPNSKKRSFISDEPKRDYGFQNFAMLLPQTATYMSAASIK